MKPCFKRQVCAIIMTRDGQIFVGRNDIGNCEVTECPRKKGEGYEKCITICQQPGHAEEMAIREAKKAGANLEGGKLYLHNHYRCCQKCLKLCEENGLQVIIMGDSQELGKEEVWRKVEGYPDYKISTKGRLKSFKRNKNGIFIKGSIYSNGYRMAVLDNKKRESFHRLVAKTFIPNYHPDKYTIINHKDGDKLNNNIENLEWCDYNHNLQHSYNNDQRIGNLGEKNGQAKLSQKEVDQILNDFRKNVIIAKDYNVTERTIRRIKNGQTWKRL